MGNGDKMKDCTICGTRHPVGSPCPRFHPRLRCDPGDQGEAWGKWEAEQMSTQRWCSRCGYSTIRHQLGFALGARLRKWVERGYGGGRFRNALCHRWGASDEH